MLDQSIQTKKCSNCQIIQPIINFHQNKSKFDGYQHNCKSCRKLYNIKNESKIQEYHKKNYQKQKNKYNQNSKIYYQQNKEKCKQINKKWIQNHFKKNREYKIRWAFQNRHNNINAKIKHNLRNRLNLALKNNIKTNKTIEYLGCSLNEFKTYFEKQFKPGMAWNNYGKGKHNWSIDHIIPCSVFDLNDPVEQKQCFHYTNLQPLWHIKNLQKNNKIIIPNTNSINN